MTSTPPVDPPGPRRTRRPLKGRTSLVTAAAIGGVLLAGTAAVAANIGILSAADSSTFGELSVTDELVPAGPGDSAATAITTAPADGVQRYDIDTAGTVWLATTTDGLALDRVAAESGWRSALSQNELGSLQVDFTNGDRTIVFTAALTDDGRVMADVTEPTGPQQTADATPAHDDEHDDDEHDDDEHDDDEHDDDEHDDDEHEGADDDD